MPINYTYMTQDQRNEHSEHLETYAKELMDEFTSIEGHLLSDEQPECIAYRADILLSALEEQGITSKRVAHELWILINEYQKKDETFKSFAETVEKESKRRRKANPNSRPLIETFNLESKDTIENLKSLAKNIAKTAKSRSDIEAANDNYEDITLSMLVYDFISEINPDSSLEPADAGEYVAEAIYSTHPAQRSASLQKFLDCVVENNKPKPKSSWLPKGVDELT